MESDKLTFLWTTMTDSGGISTQIKIQSPPQLISLMTTKGDISSKLGDLIYGYIDWEGYTKKSTEMSLEEFDDFINYYSVDPSKINPEFIYYFFKSDIDRKYGVAALKKNITFLKLEDLTPFHLYKDFDGNIWKYYGEVAYSDSESSYEKGYCFKKSYLCFSDTVIYNSNKEILSLELLSEEGAFEIDEDDIKETEVTLNSFHKGKNNIVFF